MAQTSNSDSQNIKEVNAIVTRSDEILNGPTKLSQPNNKNVAAIPSDSGDASLQECEKKILVQVSFPQALKTEKLLKEK